MKKYQDAIHSSIQYCSNFARTHEIITLNDKNTLTAMVKESNKVILSAFLNEFPNDSVFELCQHYLNNYMVAKLYVEQNKQKNYYNIKLSFSVLDFSQVISYFQFFFPSTPFIKQINDLLFYLISSQKINLFSNSEKEDLMASLCRILDLNFPQPLTTKFIYAALHRYLKFAFNNNIDATSKYSKKKYFNIIIAHIYKISGNFYVKYYFEKRKNSRLHPSNILTLLMNGIVAQQVYDSQKNNHQITRHPSWCYHNINSKNRCDIFDIKCHSTIGCPFFCKIEKLPSGAIKLSGPNMEIKK